MFSRSSSPISALQDTSTMAIPRRFMVFTYAFGTKVYDVYETLNRMMWLSNQYRISLAAWGHIGRSLDRFRFDMEPDKTMMIAWVVGEGYSEADQWFLDNGVEVMMDDWVEDPDLEVNMMQWGRQNISEIESVNSVADTDDVSDSDSD